MGFKFVRNSKGISFEWWLSWITQSLFGHRHNWLSIRFDGLLEFVDDDEDSDPIELGGE
jgi:hypothetical protein